MLKKLVKLLIAILFLSQSHLSIINADDFDFNDDDIDLEMIQDWENEHVSPAIGGLPSRSWSIIADNLSKSIQTPLWKNTRLPHSRDVLYLFPNDVMFAEKNSLAFSPFFNMTKNVHPALSGFIDLNINEQAAIDVIEQALLILPGADAITAQELFNLLPLFGKISVQERRNGLYFRKSFVHRCFEAELTTSPFVFCERNFWLNQKDQAVINEIGNTLFPGRKLDQNKFVRMRFGVGDTRIKLGLKPLDLPKIKTSVGASLILPTGSIGHQSRLNPINIHSNNLIQFSYPAIINIRDYLLDAQLGNAGHFSLGIYAKSKVTLFKDLADFYWELSYDKLLPATEDRLMLYNTTTTPASLNGTSSDLLAIQALQVFIPQYIIPLPFSTKVQPGDIFNATAGLNVGVNRWHWLLGYNYYLQQKETFKKIYNTNDISKIRINDATIGSTDQHKIFWETTYTKPLKKTDLLISWGTNFTVRSRGLGNDWTSYCKFGAAI